MRNQKNYAIIIEQITDSAKINILFPYILPKKLRKSNNFIIFAAVVKLADALDSKSSGLIPRVGSSPTSGTTNNDHPFLGGRYLFCSLLDENRRFITAHMSYMGFKF